MNVHLLSCFLAETKTGNDRYIYISNDTDWYGAQAYCRQHHTDLASARDENENSVIASLIYYKTWIGLLKDPWKWVDHTNFSYISWSYGKPNNIKWNENCGYLYMGEATDAWCSDIMPFFCYSGMLKYVELRFICIQIQIAFRKCNCVFMSTSRKQKTTNCKNEDRVRSGFEGSCRKCSHFGEGGSHPP